MITTLTDTTSSAIASALLKARRAMGSPATGMVMTIVISCTEAEQDSAVEAAVEAGREHPSRILVAVTGRGRQNRLDAEVRIGEGTPGEIVILQMYGRMATHAASVVRPLLLPDSPVVVWWPGAAPADLAHHELGRLATRRVSDAMGSARPLQALRLRAENYQPGDTDLAWTRTTQWRSLLAASLDQYPATVLGATVSAERNSAAAKLLVAWLEARLKVPVKRGTSEGPGITKATLETAAGDIAIVRTDGRLASYSVPGQPKRLVALKRRPVADLMAEELRRMDPDDAFRDTIKALPGPAKKSTAKKTAAKRTAAKKATATKAAAKKSATKKTTARKTATKKATTKKAS
ncbi:MAG TPA: glucose-6-phosphate dehydrogenase assembly protein OpcA [Candidatus Avipropionibacterium avicola]|uniref:Glucose-6-phosphate dehydrogenase assembly protein OpcA n=1 Tax=Candidatus Avipropionibacterium avicola TaxID=2840701 RepID=A0A9D1KMH3_9ACTN|nr:glucose-6-phosphate dehydrogenase assembly protein OpcA [Candidatus Avipropionibacterium avicola]